MIASKAKILVLFLVLLVAGHAAAKDGPSSLSVAGTRAWAILSGGRAKPLETFAAETLSALSGRSRAAGMNALTVLWGLHLDEGRFRKLPLMRLYNNDLKRHIGLPVDQRRFAFDAIRHNKAFQTLYNQALDLKNRGQRLNPIQKEAYDLYPKLQLVENLGRRGGMLTLVPVVREDGNWSTFLDMRGQDDPKRKAVYTQYEALTRAYAKGDAAGFAGAVDALTAALRAVGPELYPPQALLDRELHYNAINPYQKSWILYLVSFIALVFLFGRMKKPGYILGMVLLALGLAAQTYGLGLRWSISGRAPLSNMYESLVFMGWGVAALGLVMELFSRRRIFAVVAAVMGFLVLFFAQNLPMDASITPLVPVLANTPWLSIHVMTIMMSYAAFALTLALANLVLGVAVFKPDAEAMQDRLSRLLYKGTQVGLFFLVTGIITGAYWANESWGRYWGWDSKETCSLITFFVYLGVVHGRFAGWFQDFGLAVGSIIGFLAVLLTYLGVNYVWGSGLHSYGVGGDRQFYVILGLCAFVVLEGLWILVAWLKSRRA